MIQRGKLHKCTYTFHPCSLILLPLILAVTLSSEMFQDWSLTGPIHFGRCECLTCGSGPPMRYHVVQHRSLHARTQCEYLTCSPLQQSYPINNYLWSLQIPPPLPKKKAILRSYNSRERFVNYRANQCKGEYFFVVANDLYRHKKTAPPTVPYLKGIDNDMIRRTTSFPYRQWCCRCLKCNRFNIFHSCIYLHLHLLTIIIWNCIPVFKNVIKNVKLTLSRSWKYKGSRFIALPILNLGARWRLVVNITPRPL
jgi:hypothetical protein